MILIYGAPCTGKSTLVSAVASKFNVCAVDVDALAMSLHPDVFSMKHTAPLRRKVVDFSNTMLECVKRSFLPGVCVTHNPRSTAILGFTFLGTESGRQAYFGEFVNRHADKHGLSTVDAVKALEAKGFNYDLVTSWIGKDRLLDSGFTAPIIEMQPGEHMLDYISFTMESGHLSITFLKDRSVYPADVFASKPYALGKKLDLPSSKGASKNKTKGAK